MVRRSANRSTKQAKNTSPEAKLPAYRLHRCSGQAVVSLPIGDGTKRRRDFLLGKYESAESRAEYQKITGAWQAAGRRLVTTAPVDGLTIAELMIEFWEHVTVYYRHSDGRPTSEQGCFKYALRPVRELFADLPAASFTKWHLKIVRDRMAADGLCRTSINARITRIRRMFKWAADEPGLVPSAVYYDLASLKNWKPGRSPAYETLPIQPVSDEHIEATLPHLNRHLRALIGIQRLTGARSGELVIMRGRDIDTSKATWLYRPATHKSKWRGKVRVIPLGPKSQMIVRQFMTEDQEAYLFSPKLAMTERAVVLRANRKTPLWPSHVKERKLRPKRVPGERYTPSAISHAVAKACCKGGIPHWHPHQIRHTVATQIEDEFSAVSAAAILGHDGLDTLRKYSDGTIAEAVRLAAAIG